MLKADFLFSGYGRIVGLCIKGHAGFEEEGRDIVCAAVSSAAYLVVNTAQEELGVRLCGLSVREGDMRFCLRPWDEPLCRSLMNGLRLHLLGLAEQYPKHIEVRAKIVSYHNILKKGRK